MNQNSISIQGLSPDIWSESVVLRLSVEWDGRVKVAQVFQQMHLFAFQRGSLRSQ